MTRFKVIDIINELKIYGTLVDIYDPWADQREVEKEYGLKMLKQAHLQDYDVIILALSHDQFKSLSWESLKESDVRIFDVKGFLDRKLVSERL